MVSFANVIIAFLHFQRKNECNLTHIVKFDIETIANN